MSNKIPQPEAEEMTMLSIPRTLHTRIKNLAKLDGRSMRSYLDRVIKEKESN